MGPVCVHVKFEKISIKNRLKSLGRLGPTHTPHHTDTTCLLWVMCRKASVETAGGGLKKFVYVGHSVCVGGWTELVLTCDGMECGPRARAKNLEKNKG